MEVNSINPSAVGYNYDLQADAKRNASNTNLLKQEAPQDSFTLTNMEKPETMESVGKGILFNIKQAIPFLGTHDVGDIEYKREAVMKKLEDSENYSIRDNEKGAVSTYGKGLLTKLQYAIPFYGAYKLGKESLEVEQAYDTIINNKNPEEMEKPGVLKCMGKGIVKFIQLAIPGVSAHTKGKDIEMINQMYEESIAQETYYENWKAERGIE